ncbi:Carrier protein, mitochondrial [Dionaea muscipula]
MGSRNGLPSWITAVAAKRVDFDFEGNVVDPMASEGSAARAGSVPDDVNLGLGERALSAAGAAVISAVIVNPLDVAKTRLQAQAAGVPYQNQCGMECFESNMMFPGLKSPRSWKQAVVGGDRGVPVCNPECSHYKGTIDVFYKVTRQEGFSRLWRGTNASLTLAIPTVAIYLPCYDIFRNYLEEYSAQNAPYLTSYVPVIAGSAARSIAVISCYPVELARTRMQVFRETHAGSKLPGVWKTLIGVVSPVRSTSNFHPLQNYRMLWTGVGAQLARDVPFSAICWATLEPIRRRIPGMEGDEAGASTILGANFGAGFIAGTLAAAATCPLDVARTRRQIEKDPARQMTMTTRQTLLEIWRDGGWKGLFTGIGPRVARAGPSVGIVVSFYEVVKHALHRRRSAAQ